MTEAPTVHDAKPMRLTDCDPWCVTDHTGHDDGDGCHHFGSTAGMVTTNCNRPSEQTFLEVRLSRFVAEDATPCELEPKVELPARRPVRRARCRSGTGWRAGETPDAATVTTNATAGERTAARRRHHHYPTWPTPPTKRGLALEPHNEGSHVWPSVQRSR